MTPINRDQEDIAKIKLDEIIKRNKKMSNILMLIGLVGMCIAFIAFIVVETNDKQNGKFLSDSLKANKIIIDSLLITKKQVDISNEKKESLINLLSEFLNLISTSDRYEPSKYYTEIVERYYLKNNVKSEEIKEEIKKYKKKHPNAKLQFNREDFDIAFKSNGSVEIYLNAQYYPDKLSSKQEIVFEIKMNSQHKIYYIRNLIPSNQKILHP